MPFFSFLNKLRRSRPSEPRESPFIPNRLPDPDLAAYTNQAADVTQDSTASNGFSRAQAPYIAHHPSGRRMLSSTMNPANFTTLSRNSSRKSTRKSSTIRRHIIRSRRVAPVDDSGITETDLSLLPSLLNDSSTEKTPIVTLHGSITKKVLDSLLTSVSQLRKLVFDEAIIYTSPSTFSSLISSMGVESLSFLGCRFTDAQLICDQFFAENEQITELTVSTKDGSVQSFPVLTDLTLERWASLGRQPPCLQLDNVVTSFTIIGVEKLIRAFIKTASPYDRFCCKLGRLNMPMDAVVYRLKRIKALKIHCVHDSFLVALGHNPRIELTLQTASSSITSDHNLTNDDTLDELPVLRRCPAMRRRVAPLMSAFGLTAPTPPVRSLRSSSTRAPESVMISKPGALSRSKRTTKERNKRRSMRVAKIQSSSFDNPAIIAFL